MKDLLDKIFLSMKIKSSCVVNREDMCLFVNITDISPSDMGIVIGRRGNTLDAIQYLLSLAINRNREDYIKVIVDIKRI